MNLRDKCNSLTKISNKMNAAKSKKYAFLFLRITKYNKESIVWLKSYFI